MLKVQEHSELLSVQYLVGCLEQEHTCHNVTWPMGGSTTKTDEGGTSYQLSPYCSTYARCNQQKEVIEPDAHNTVRDSNLSKNKLLNDYRLPINDEETLLQRSQQTTVSQLRS